jgi:hypothetical protein
MVVGEVLLQIIEFNNLMLLAKFMIFVYKYDVGYLIVSKNGKANLPWQSNKKWKKILFVKNIS